MTTTHKANKQRKEFAKKVAENWSDLLLKQLHSNLYSCWCDAQPPTKAQLIKWERERKARELKEKRRRAKKITMTVGELEDKIAEAEDRYRDEN